MLPLRFFLLLWTASAILHAQNAAVVKRLDGSTITASEIDQTVARLMKAADVPGVGLVLINDGQIAYLKAYGFRDVDEDVPLRVDSVMSAASFSKVAFAYLAMQLVQQGVLELDKPVYQYLPRPLPTYPNYKDLVGDSRLKQITARMLLSHTSGFPNWRRLNDDHKLNINFTPGSRFAYSGEGIDLLQLVIETITRKPLERLMQENVFRPLGMSRTSMVWQDGFETDFANGYDETENSLGPERRKTADAAGSMQTTIRDFAQFAQAILAGKGLQNDIREEMLSPQVRILSRREFPTLANDTTDNNASIRLSYGLGWGLYWTPYGKALFKEGHDDGWRHYTVCFDDQKTGIVIMTNSANGEGIYKELLETLLKNTFTPIEWESFTPYQELPPRQAASPGILQPRRTVVTLDAELLSRYAGNYSDGAIVVDLRLDGDHLAIHQGEAVLEQLVPESPTQFFSKWGVDEFTFEAAAHGRVTTMVVRAGGRDLPLKRTN